MKVLIVEDSISARKLLRITFEHYDCTVVEARDGQEGLDLAARHKPDIIISDALMPRMDGFQLLRALKADQELKTIPFIFYSSTYTGEKEEELALSLGAEAFVPKPAEPSELWEKTRAITGECEARQGKPAHLSMDDGDEKYLREYGRIVATKLEEKVLELEEALSMRQKAEAELRTLNYELSSEIAERKRVENAIKEQEQELSTIFENAPFIMLLLDSDRRIQRVNGLACTFARSSIRDMTGRRSGDALRCLHALENPEGCGFGPNCQTCVIRLTVKDTFETGRSHHNLETSLPFSIEGREQVIFFLISAIKVVVRDNDMVLVSLQDISEHKKLEEQLRQAQKMESIGTLAGGIAHDFNNILTTIIGYGQISLMNMPEGDPCRHNIEQMLAAADKAAHLTSDLLLFSRKQVSVKRTIDLNDVIRSVEKFLTRVIGEDITCNMQLADMKIPVYADAHQLEQVMMNLATNARDAMPDGGTFTISCERTHIDEAFISATGNGTPGRYAVLAVTDSGTGMEEETRQHIFDPFFTTKEVGKGTGLGMAVAYGIIKQHHGFINVQSELGKGTSFRIYLPLIESVVDEEKIMLEAEHPRMGTETILLAEDDESVRKMTVAILQNFGYEVIIAVDGEDAVKKYLDNKDRIQLLLFDLIMPHKTGKEAYDEIREITPDIKVIFASGYTAEVIRQKGLLDNNMTLIFKPYLPSVFLQKVRKVLDEEKRPPQIEQFNTAATQS